MSTANAKTIWIFLIQALLLLESAACAGRKTAAPVPAANRPGSELRAFWVDEFHEGIRTPQEADQLVEDALRANVNTLIVQVRGRADALYTHSFEPPHEDPAYDPNFDALQNILDVAHRAGLEVHAWVNAMPVWRDPQPPRDARHVFNVHGPGQSAEADWLTRSPTGETRFPVGYFLDPGHPAAAAYIAEVYRNIVQHYAVDGVHFDYIRYPETKENLRRGAAVGYNPTSLERFRRITGRTDVPPPDDKQWIDWRRQQVTQVVRRVYLEMKAINPRMKVSAAVIPWGRPPRSEKDFENAAPMQRVFQDWNGWLKEGILDMAMPMNYAREADVVVRQWFDGWLRWEKSHKHDREIVIGLGAYLNLPASTLAQVRRARQPQGNDRVDGLAFFSYAHLSATQPRANETSSSGVAISGPETTPSSGSFLTRGASPEPAVFPEPATVPTMGWIEQPPGGWVAGFAKAVDLTALDGVNIALRRRGWLQRTRHAVSDGNGFFGFAKVKPGQYQVCLDERKREKVAAEIQVIAGQLARVELVRRP